MKQKKCKQCKKPFSPFNTLQTVCGPDCAIEQAREKRAREYKKETTRLRREYYDNDKTHWKKKATTACHQYIHARDAHCGCISCGISTGKFDAGHYRTRAAAGQIAFCEHNIHKQCFQCNQPKSGNIGEYRIRLVEKIGLEMVEYLENNNETYSYTVDDYKDIFEYYREKLADIKKAANEGRLILY